jgi:hypothetical protein
MEQHERFTITISFTVCEGLRDKVLDEIKELRHYIDEKSLDHASDVKYVVSRKIEEKEI